MIVAALIGLGCLSTVDDTAPADSGGTADTVDDTAAEARAADDARVRALDTTQLPTASNPCAAPQLVRVNYAVDGDTFYVYPDGGGQSVKVRMIGVDTPEIAHDNPAECWGDAAFDYTEAALEGKLVWLTFDRECLDRYDRTLAYVARDVGTAGFYNRELVRQGQATAFEVPPNSAFASDIEADERAARSEGLGLWGACGR